jgi:putative endonuclease
MRAELAAASWLSACGWRVLARRWRSAAGELDLVCVDPNGALVGIEVKLRRSARAGSALEAVDRRRVLRLRRSLAAFAATSDRRWRALRIDLVTVEPSAGRAWLVRRHPGIDGW